LGEGCHASHQPSDASTPKKLKIPFDPTNSTRTSSKVRSTHG